MAPYPLPALIPYLINSPKVRARNGYVPYCTYRVGNLPYLEHMEISEALLLILRDARKETCLFRDASFAFRRRPSSSPALFSFRTPPLVIFFPVTPRQSAVVPLFVASDATQQNCGCSSDE